MLDETFDHSKGRPGSGLAPGLADKAAMSRPSPRPCQMCRCRRVMQRQRTPRLRQVPPTPGPACAGWPPRRRSGPNENGSSGSSRAKKLPSLPPWALTASDPSRLPGPRSATSESRPSGGWSAACNAPVMGFSRDARRFSEFRRLRSCATKRARALRHTAHPARATAQSSVVFSKRDSVQWPADNGAETD